MDATELRFWQKVDRSPGYGPWGNCWLWIGASEVTGGGSRYVRGEFYLSPKTSLSPKKICRPHRYSFFLFHGRWPQPECCHTCDLGLCVNPRHLFEGSHADNMRDAAAKGRPVGQPRRLTEAQAIEILLLGGLDREIAKKYGVSRSVISNLRSGRYPWEHLGGVRRARRRRRRSP
jgi:hypothetical protein